MSGDKITPASLRWIAEQNGLDYFDLLKRAREEYDSEHGGDAVRQVQVARELRLQGVDWDSDGVEVVAPSPLPEVEMPPGMAGTAARWLEAGNLAPNPMASIASVLALPAALCGRAWTNDSPQRADGLNLYLCLLSPSGGGKEWMWGGLRAMLGEAGMRGRSGVIAPRPASGQALCEMIDKAPCCVVPLQEMGKWLSRVLSPKANGAEMALQSEILSLYNESDEHGEHSGTAKAGQGATKSVFSPCLSLLGDSTHSSLWLALSDEAARSGLLSRMVILDAGTVRPMPRERATMGPCPMGVRDALTAMAGQREDATREDIRGRRRIAWSDEAVKVGSELFHAWAGKFQRGGESYALLASRARQNAPRIAGVLALWDDPLEPIVQAPHIDWAWSIVERGIACMEAAFASGEIQDSAVDLDAVVLEYMRAKAVDGVISRNKLRAWASFAPAFRGISREKLSHALNSTLQSLEDSGSIAKMGREDRSERGIRGEAYAVS